MILINELLNILFLYKSNKTSEIKFHDIHSFKIYIEKLKIKMNEEKNIDLTDNDRKIIKDIILYYNYPIKLKKPAYKLYKYTNIDNLIICAINLLTITIENSFTYRKINDSFLVSDGIYYSDVNKIRYRNKDAIPHEFLHMSSNMPSLKGISKLGFSTFQNGKIYAQGLNEGYTEMLSRRIYFNENYNGRAYTTKVYALRLLELLYDKKEEMEKDYLKANFSNLKKTFLKFGTISELDKIIYALDIPEWDLSKEEKIELLAFIKKIIKRKEEREETELIIDEFKAITKVKNY